MNGVQSILDPAGPGGASIALLWWVMFGTGTLVFVLVVLALVMAIRRAGESRRRGPDETDKLTDVNEPDQRIAKRWVSAALGGTVAILLATFTLSLLTSRATAGIAGDDMLEIEVTGVQWWWDVRYLDSIPARNVRIANELHLPAGRPVRLRLISRDVIHSFWAPNLHGKMDIIPGRENTLVLRADQPGTYRAQCAEFCGLQHAKMAMVIVVHTADEFDAWLDAELQPAAEPADELARSGARVFMANACSTCHSIRGTEAYGRVGPDLTHLGRRLTLAAAELPNTRANLGAWITAPQVIKPGSHMPSVSLSNGDLIALVAYLEGLR